MKLKIFPFLLGILSFLITPIYALQVTVEAPKEVAVSSYTVNVYVKGNLSYYPVTILASQFILPIINTNACTNNTIILSSLGFSIPNIINAKFKSLSFRLYGIRTTGTLPLTIQVGNITYSGSCEVSNGTCYVYLSLPDIKTPFNINISFDTPVEVCVDEYNLPVYEVLLEGSSNPYIVYTQKFTIVESNKTETLSVIQSKSTNVTVVVYDPVENKFYIVSKEVLYKPLTEVGPISRILSVEKPSYIIAGKKVEEIYTIEVVAPSTIENYTYVIDVKYCEILKLYLDDVLIREDENIHGKYSITIEDFPAGRHYIKVYCSYTPVEYSLEAKTRAIYNNELYDVYIYEVVSKYPFSIDTVLLPVDINTVFARYPFSNELINPVVKEGDYYITVGPLQPFQKMHILVYKRVSPQSVMDYVSTLLKQYWMYIMGAMAFLIIVILLI